VLKPDDHRVRLAVVPQRDARLAVLADAVALDNGRLLIAIPT
jgi:hypothetical protein